MFSASNLPVSRKARVIAFYLPQYHQIPENDAWWGEGFTEWTNVRKAQPLFSGHVQPRLPGELGFYDLRLPSTREAQAKLAREYGVEGFCYWHYWFAGRRILETPFNSVLARRTPDLPFCLAWANESWTGVWHGNPERILLEQTYPGDQDIEQHFFAVLPAFLDPRYIRVEGKPLFLIYKPRLIPGGHTAFVDRWRGLARQHRLNGLHFVAFSSGSWKPIEEGFDGYTQHLPLTSGFSSDTPRRQSYASYIQQHAKIQPTDEGFYPSVLSNWDNTPRCGERGFVLEGSTPDLFRDHLRSTYSSLYHRDSERRIIFLKSWNEWAEGNYIEPDLVFGRRYLEAVRDAFE